jgi:hypothetical protein
MTPEAEVIEAINDFCAAVESQREVPALQIFRDKQLSRATRLIQNLTRSRFRLQRKALLDSHALRNLKPQESDAAEEDRIRLQLSELILHQPVTATDSALYDAAIRQALSAGADGVSTLLSTSSPETESFIAEYLKDGGFTQLTGEIDKTTVDRLASAIADAYEAGEDFDGVVAAVKSEFTDFTTARAKMIAQTELNNAYNESIAHFGRQAGATMKSWETDAAPCLICTENAIAGQIPIDDDFPSGDDQPGAHPNCLCSLLVHVV